MTLPNLVSNYYPPHQPLPCHVTALTFPLHHPTYTPPSTTYPHTHLPPHPHTHTHTHTHPHTHPMTLLDTYESDYQLALSDARSKLAGGSLLASTVQAVEQALDEAQDVLDQMNIEMQNLPAPQRAEPNKRIRQHRADVAELRRKVAAEATDAERAQLFGRYTDEPEQRLALLANNAAMERALERALERLRDSQRVAHETEAIGGNILNDLRAQREQIVNLRNTLLAADLYVDKLIQTLRAMSRRITANKFISYAIIAVLIVLIFLVLASKFT